MHPIGEYVSGYPRAALIRREPKLASFLVKIYLPRVAENTSIYVYRADKKRRDERKSYDYVSNDERSMSDRSERKGGIIKIRISQVNY